MSKLMNVTLSIIVLLSCIHTEKLLAADVSAAFESDILDLCDGKAANELFKIANKNNNSDEERRNALSHMLEVSAECNRTTDQRLTQYHQKMVNAAHKVIELSEIDSRQVAVEALQYVINRPDQQQPPGGAIARGNKLSEIALTDSEPNIRLWALEALVNLKGGDSIVESTLLNAILDGSEVVRQTAEGMHHDLF